MMPPVRFRFGENDRIRVVKVGGSLLESPAIEQIPDWLSRQPNSINLLVVGGGRAVNQIREMQETAGFSDSVAHWRSIASMGKTAAFVSKRLMKSGHDFPMKDCMEAGALAERHGSVILKVEEFLRNDAGQPNALPWDWTVTSDSIAARIASVAEADELVLLKSTTPGASPTVASMADEGIVDQHFPTVFDRPELRIVNARKRNWPELSIDTTDSEIRITTRS